jgi:uncharacterized protein (TIGR02391 family)
MESNTPISKPYLKKLILKELLDFEQKTTDKLKRIDAEGIKDNLFKRTRNRWLLQDSSKEEINTVIFELERESLVQPNHTISASNNRFKRLSKEGTRIAKQKNAEIPDGQIITSLHNVITDDTLLKLVQISFENGDYNNAIQSAYKLLEEMIRSKIGAVPYETGDQLVIDAFKKNGGILKHSGAVNNNEFEGLFFLFSGAVKWFRNRFAHRTIKVINPQQALHILAYANMLIDLLKECETK